MDSADLVTNESSLETSSLPIQSEISTDETTVTEKSADISFPQVSIATLVEEISNENKRIEDLFTVDTEGDEYMAMAEKALPQPTSSTDNRLLKGDLKIAAKYQWRQGKQFCDGNDADSSSESDDEDFNKILQTQYAETDESEVKKPKEHKKVMNNALDKEYYELPDFEALSLTCLESCIIEPFGKVFQHYDALAMIKANPNKPYLDLDTMLFTSEKIPVGRIYELIGLVNDPIYNILFASIEDAVKLPVGTELFYAPTADITVTKILCLEELRNNSKWQNKDEGLGESDDGEDDEEAQYFNNLKKQVEEYEQRKRGRNDSVSSATTTRSFGPTQPKQRRYNNFTPRSQNYGNNGNRYPGVTHQWRQPSYPHYPSYQQFNNNPFALPPQPSYYVPHGLFNYPPPANAVRGSIVRPAHPPPPSSDS